MTDEQLELLQAVTNLVFQITGKLDALQVTQDAVLTQLVKTFPPMQEGLSETLHQAATLWEKNVAADSLETFRTRIENVQQGLLLLK